MSTRSLHLVPGLALADLYHEWVLTLCLVIAVAAVVAPILILQGLRHGTLMTLRDRLVQDPVYREVRPTQTREYPPQWFQQLSHAPEVGFLLPTVLPASSILRVIDPRTGRRHTLDLVPTADGDPLLLENGARIPAEGECVLTAEASSELRVQAGDTLEVHATRSRNGASEHGVAHLKVIAVLDPRAGTLPRIYAPLQFVLDVETYKEGRGIPARKWDGAIPYATPTFDSVWVLVDYELDAVARTGMLVNTGLVDIETLSDGTVLEKLGIRLPETWAGYRLSVPNGAVGSTNLEALRRKLRGRGAILVPYVSLTSLKTDGLSARIVGLSLTESQARRLGVAAPPWGGYRRDLRDQTRLRQILIPTGDALDPRGVIELGAEGVANIRFPVKIAGNSPVQDIAYVPAELLGILHTGRLRPLIFDGESFSVARAGFRGFRLYARTIDEVPTLVDRLREKDIEVTARVDDIRRIQILDQGLGRLVWLVASLGVTGGIAVLAASLYAAVQRGRKGLAVLRLVGLTRSDVFLFPVYQAAAMALLGFVIAVAAYGALSTVINQVFANDMDLGQRLCTLPAMAFVVSGLALLAIAINSSFLAAWATTRIDPAESIREE